VTRRSGDPIAAANLHSPTRRGELVSMPFVEGSARWRDHRAGSL